MRVKVDINNPKFGKLVAICPAPKYKKGHWQCLCDCGRVYFACSSKLRAGNIKSCGCFRVEHCRPVGKLGTLAVGSIDWLDSDWSYLLGMIHGDGHVHKGGVSTSVAYADANYADVLIDIWVKKGFIPKLTKRRNSLSVDVFIVELAHSLTQYKNLTVWSIPSVFNKADYLAGLVDTDGTIRRPRQVSIYQKSNGNLFKVFPLFAELGIEAHLYKINSKYKGQSYPIDSITICKSSEVVAFYDLVSLRHPRKSDQLTLIRQHLE